MQLNVRGLLSLLPLAVVPSAVVSAPAPLALDGYVFTIQTPGRDGGAPGTLTVKMAGTKVRMEPDGLGAMLGGGGGRGGAPEMAAGAFLLPMVDGKLAIVLPNMTMMGPGGLALSIAAGSIPGASAQTDITHGTMEDLGAGETIAGHPSRRYRFRDAATPDESFEMAFSTDLPGADFKTFASAFGAQFGIADAAAIAKMPTGFPLKMIQTSKGVTTTAWEVTRVEKSAFEPSVFEIPAGMQVMDGGALMGGRGGRGRGRGNQ